MSKATSSPLSPMQRDILLLSVRGYSVAAMAEALAVTCSVIYTMRYRFLRKLGVSTAEDALQHYAAWLESELADVAAVQAEKAGA